jgi:hypothetical protein
MLRQPRGTNFETDPHHPAEAKRSGEKNKKNNVSF